MEISRYDFETYALPLLLKLSDAPQKSVDPVAMLTEEIGVDREAALDLVALLHSAQYIEVVMTEAWGEPRPVAVGPASITHKGLIQLSVWPSNDQRAQFLIERVVETIEQMASNPDLPEDSRSKLSAAGSVIRDFTVEVVAGVTAASIGTL